MASGPRLVEPASEGRGGIARPARAPLLPAIWVTTIGLSLLYVGLYVVFGSGRILGETPWYVPTMHSIVGLASVLVAFAALGRDAVLPQPDTYWIGTGFGAFGLQSVLLIFAWPGLFPNGSAVLAHRATASMWIAVFHVATLSGFLLAASASRWPAAHDLTPRRRRLSAAVCVLLAVLPCFLVILVAGRLPVLIDAQGRFHPSVPVLNLVYACVLAAGAVLSVRHYARTADPLRGVVAIAQVLWVFVMLGAYLGGKRFDVWNYLGRILMATGAFVLLCGLVADHVRLLRDERARSAELEEVHRRLESADKRKNNYLSMLAHELRNPLAALSGAVTLLSARVESRNDLRPATEVATRQVRHMARLLDDLLDIARITRGTIGLRRERLDVREAVAIGIEMVIPVIESRRHRLEVSLPSEPLLVQGDRARLSQVVMNMLDNAAKYTPAGGRLAVSAVKEGSQVLITVRDTGPGIPLEIRPHLFQAFERGQISVGGSEGGLGLGLALVRQIVDLHGGSVGSADVPGGGTEFAVRLPESPGAEPDLPRPDTVTPAQPRGRVLVVDDDADVVQMLAMLLESEGWEVMTATSGDAALALAAEWKPGSVVVDISMPGMDGFEVARRLRADPPVEGVRIVAVTGYGDEAYRVRALSSGFDHYLVKPADVLSLRRALQAAAVNS